MITYVWGDLFTSPAQTLVNTVNTVGVMGKGIAKEFKFFFPEMFEAYRDMCDRGELKVGKLLLYRTPHKMILNFPTKRHWRQRSRVADLELGLQSFVAGYERNGIISVAFPQLGCGNGELDWETQVRPLMERYLGSLPIDVYIHLYDGGTVLPEHRNAAEMKRWLRSEPRDLAFSEVWDDIVSDIHRNGTDARIVAGWQLSVSTIENQDVIVFKQPDQKILLWWEDLFDIWQRIRSFGLLAERDLPASALIVSGPLFELLLFLPYIQETKFQLGVSEEHLTSESSGVRLVPMVKPERSAVQQSLLAGANVV